MPSILLNVLVDIKKVSARRRFFSFLLPDSLAPLKTRRAHQQKQLKIMSLTHYKQKGDPESRRRFFYDRLHITVIVVLLD